MCVFVSGQAENGSECVGTAPVSACLSLLLSFPQTPGPYVCACGEGLSWKVIMGNEQKPNKVHLDWLVSLGKVGKLSL